MGSPTMRRAFTPRNGLKAAFQDMSINVVHPDGLVHVTEKVHVQRSELCDRAVSFFKKAYKGWVV